METRKYLFWIMMVFAILVVSCDKDDEDDKESCDSEDFSEDFGCPVDVDAIATFCSDGTNNSYYIYNDTNYVCSGVEASTCDEAINQIGILLIEQGCGTKKSGNIDAGLIELSAMAERLLIEVRTKSICN